MIRLDEKRRRQIIVKAGVSVAKERGILHVTAQSVAAKCEIETSPATVRRYFFRIERLRDEIEKELSDGSTE